MTDDDIVERVARAICAVQLIDLLQLMPLEGEMMARAAIAAYEDAKREIAAKIAAELDAELKRLVDDGPNHRKPRCKGCGHEFYYEYNPEPGYCMVCEEAMKGSNR